MHQNPGPATKYPCSVCTSNVTSRGVSYMCNRCSGWVRSKCYGLQNAAEYRRIKNWACISCSSPPTSQIPKPLPSPTKASDGDPFTILQFNANGIGNKQVELGDFLERHKVKVSVIQESNLTLISRTPNIQNFTTVRKDRDQGQGGRLLTLIHKSINFPLRPVSPDTLADPLADPHLEELEYFSICRCIQGGIAERRPKVANACCCCCLPSETYGRNVVTSIFRSFHRTASSTTGGWSR